MENCLKTFPSLETIHTDLMWNWMIQKNSEKCSTVTVPGLDHNLEEFEKLGKY